MDQGFYKLEVHTEEQKKAKQKAQGGKALRPARKEEAARNPWVMENKSLAVGELVGPSSGTLGKVLY